MVSCVLVTRSEEVDWSELDRFNQWHRYRSKLVSYVPCPRGQRRRSGRDAMGRNLMSGRVLRAPAVVFCVERSMKNGEVRDVLYGTREIAGPPGVGLPAGSHHDTQD